jgi:DMSO reductase anchor subunit
LLLLRLASLLAGVGWLAVTVTRVIRKSKSPGEILTPVYVSCLLVLVGETLGRFMFYATHVRVGL